MKLAAWILWPLLVQAGDYVNKTSVEADREMARIASVDPSKLIEEEKVAWARARLAWISLKRLQGREDEALVLFAGCGNVCAAHGPSKEWQATRTWGCGKKKEAPPCLIGKTKAQKPPL